MNKRVLITGASSGIGKELAILYAKNNYDLILVAQNVERLKQIKDYIIQENGVDVLTYNMDLTIQSNIQDLYNDLKANDIKVDGLINNAGFGMGGLFIDTDNTKNIKMVELNIISLMELTHLFLKDFKILNQGFIINMSSSASLIPGPRQAVYFASKAFVTSFSNALSYELKDTNIKVLNVMPGAVATNFAKSANLENSPLFKKGVTPKLIAEKTFKAQSKNKANLLVGIPLFMRISLLFSSLIPKRIIMKVIDILQR